MRTLKEEQHKRQLLAEHDENAAAELKVGLRLRSSSLCRASVRGKCAHPVSTVLQALRARVEELTKQLADVGGVAARCSVLESELNNSSKSLADARLEGAGLQAALAGAQKRIPELEAQIEEEAQGWARCSELEAELAAANKRAARVSELESELESTKARARRASIITSEMSDELAEAKMVAETNRQLEDDLAVCNKHHSRLVQND